MGGGKAYPFLLDEARCSGKDRIQCSEPASIQISQMRSSPGASGWPASVKTRAARAGRSFLPPLGSATAKSLAGWSPSVLRFVWTLRATFVDFIPANNPVRRDKIHESCPQRPHEPEHRRAPSSE